MVLIDKTEELISRDERMFLENVILQHPALSADGVSEQGIMSLAEPEQRCWAEPGNFRHLMTCIKQQCVAGADYSSLTLSKLTKHFAVVWVEGHKDVSNIIEKNFFFFFFLQISLMLAKEALRRWTGWLPGSYPLVFALQPTTRTSSEPAAETLALW